MYSQFQHPGQQWLRLHKTEPERTGACAVIVWEERRQDVTSRVRTYVPGKNKPLKHLTTNTHHTPSLN